MARSKRIKSPDIFLLPQTPKRLSAEPRERSGVLISEQHLLLGAKTKKENLLCGICSFQATKGEVMKFGVRQNQLSQTSSSRLQLAPETDMYSQNSRVLPSPSYKNGELVKYPGLELFVASVSKHSVDQNRYFCTKSLNVSLL